MKKSLYILVITAVLCGISHSQWVNNYWANSYGDNNLTEARGLKVTIDNYGNCYVAGYTTGEFTGKDMLVIKYNSQGDTLWTRSYNGSGNSDDQAFGLTVDNSGNIYITGTVNISGKSFQLALLKYNSNGDLVWDRNYGATEGNLEDRGLGIAVDNNGGIYVTGYCTDNDNHTDLLTIKYGSDGNQEWIAREDGNDNLDAQGFGIAVDNSGKINITGYCSTYNGSDDIIFVKYNSDGTLITRQMYNGNAGGEDRAFGIAVDESDNIYITGYLTVDSAGNTDCVTLKYSPTDSLLWAETFNGDADSEDKTFGIVVDGMNNVYVTGHATNSVSMQDYVTIKYDTDGYEQWYKFYNGPANGDDKANAIALLCNGNDVVVTGASWGTNENNDYATIKYAAADGNQLVASRYSMTGNSDDVANDVASKDGCQAVVTGFSELIIEGSHNSSAVSTMMIGGEGSELTTKNNNPQEFKLHQNYPNPFNPSTTIKFEISKTANVKLVIYDMLGRELYTLVNQQLKAGSYDFNFTTSNLASGVYFYRLSAEGYQDIKKMSFIK